MCLGSLLHDLGCAGAPTGSQAPGVSSEKMYKISKIQQDKAPVWEKRLSSVKHGCTQSLAEGDLAWSCALQVCIPNYLVFI